MRAFKQMKLMALILALMVPALFAFVFQSNTEVRVFAQASERLVSRVDLAAPNQKDSGWDLPPDAARTKNPVDATPESIARGKKLYTTNCLFCHGEKGDGTGPVAASLPTKPADLTNKQEVAKYSDGELFWMITKGKKPMPGFEKTLSEQDRWHVINYVRTLAK